MTNTDHPFGGAAYEADASTGLIFDDVRVGLVPNQRCSDARTQEAARVTIDTGEGNRFKFAVALGSITEADADAIAIPATPQFGMAHGRIGLAVVEDMDTLAGVQPTYNPDNLGDGPGAQFFRDSQRQTREFLAQSDQAEVPICAAAPFPGGSMAKRGIDTIVLTNLGEPDDERLTAEAVSLAVRNALRAAEYAGATSLAITEFGTGMHAHAFTRTSNAWAAYIDGYMQYIEMAGQGEAMGTIAKLSVVTRARPDERNAQEAGKLLDQAVGIAIEG